jgi:hypothetical protein
MSALEIVGNNDVDLLSAGCSATKAPSVDPFSGSGHPEPVNGGGNGDGIPTGRSPIVVTVGAGQEGHVTFPVKGMGGQENVVSTHPCWRARVLLELQRSPGIYIRGRRSKQRRQRSQTRPNPAAK